MFGFARLEMEERERKLSRLTWKRGRTRVPSKKCALLRLHQGVCGQI